MSTTPPRLAAKRGVTLNAEQAARINAGLSTFFAAHPLARELLEATCRDTIEAHSASSPQWEYLQMDPRVVASVDQWITAHAKRKNDTRAIWLLIIQHVDRRDGRITLNRQEIADATGIAPRNVSTCMRDLASTGTIKPIETGRTVVYMLNPHVATKLGRVAGYQARQGHARPALATRDGQAIDAPHYREDPRQRDLEDAVAAEMQRTGRLPWEMP